MDISLKRKPSTNGATFGQLFVDGQFEAYSLEDEIREITGEPVAMWKVDKKTAIPQGRYRITLEASHRFGPDTITINNVPGFTSIRIHAGNSVADTEGCPIVGDQINQEAGTISGGTVRGVLKRLKAKIKAVIDHEEVWISIENPV